MAKTGAATGKVYKDGTPKRKGLNKDGSKRTESPAQKEVRARFTARVKGGDMPRTSTRRARTDGELQPTVGREGVIDRTPHVPEPPKLRGPQFTLNRRLVAEYEIDDTASLAAALLYALRLKQSRIDGEGARYEALLDEWFGDDEAAGRTPNVNLKAEVDVWMQVLKALPFVAQKMGFTGEEWAQAWNSIAGEVSILPVGPPVLPGLDAPFPPARGTVSERFAPPLSLGVRIDAPLGTPVIAPEDLRVLETKRTGARGNHLLLRSRDPATGLYPFVRGPTGAVSLPGEGVRVHTFAHLSTFAAGLKSGDEIERGAVLGSVGATGAVGEPGLWWQVQIYVEDVDGKVKAMPMDPGDLVPYDVLGGVSPARPPSPSWTIVDPKDPSRTIEAPSYNVHASGDIIFRGTKVTTKIGDIDILSAPFRAPSEFDELERRAGPVESIARFGGGAVGALFGGPAGALGGARVGQALGGALDSLFGGGQRRPR